MLRIQTNKRADRQQGELHPKGDSRGFGHEEAESETIMSDASSAEIARREDLVLWDHNAAKKLRRLLALLKASSSKRA